MILAQCKSKTNVFTEHHFRCHDVKSELLTTYFICLFVYPFVRLFCLSVHPFIRVRFSSRSHPSNSERSHLGFVGKESLTFSSVYLFTLVYLIACKAKQRKEPFAAAKNSLKTTTYKHRGCKTGIYQKISKKCFIL